MRFLTVIVLCCLSAMGAETAFYVNTTVSSGGDGSAGDPWATLQEAITHNNLDISAPRVIYCVGATADTLPVTQTHWNSVATTKANYLRIVGDNTTGKWDATKYHREHTNDDSIYNNLPPDISFENVQIKITGTTSSGETYVGLRLSTQNVGLGQEGRTDLACQAVNCIVWTVRTGSDAVVAYGNSAFADGTSGTMKLINCVAFGSGNYGFQSAWSGIENYNCTTYGVQYGFSDAQIVINCLAVTNGLANAKGFDNVGTGGGLSDYNASNDGTAPGAHSQTGLPSFVDPSSGDFHLTSSDTVAKGNGVSNPTSGLVLVDIDGQTRSTHWDIGADEYTATGTYSIPSTNRIDWTYTGVPGGIPARTTIYTNFDASATVSQINAAIQSCPSNQTVLLTNATYTFSSTILLANGVTLRGAGRGSTVIQSSANPVIDSDQLSWTGSPQTISSGATKGSTSLTLSTTPNANFAIGALVKIDCLDDTNFVFATTGEGRHRRSTHRVTNVAGNVLTITPPLPDDFPTTPLAYYLAFSGGAPTLSMAGVESLSITNTSTSDIIQFVGTDRCWVYDCDLSGLNNIGVYFVSSLQGEVRKCTIHDAHDFPDNSDGFGVYVYEDSAFVRVEDNISYRIGDFFLQSHSTANAILYNYSTNMNFASWDKQTGNYNAGHGAHPEMCLFEGNIGEQWQHDGYHGSASHQIIFRNWFHGLNGANTGNRKMVDLTRGTYFCYVVGNILGDSTWTNSSGFAWEMTGEPDYTEMPVIFRFGYPNSGNNDSSETVDNAWQDDYSIAYPDAKTKATVTIHQNFDTYTLMTTGNGIINVEDEPTTIPDSLIYSEKPSFFGSLAWPPFDPSNPSAAGVLNIPAGERFANGGESGGGGTSGGSSGVSRVKVLRIGTIRRP